MMAASAGIDWIGTHARNPTRLHALATHPSGGWSVCVPSFPTAVLQFTRVNRKIGKVIARHRVIASLVVLHEGDSAGLN